jgi:hypothetical protein
MAEVVPDELPDPEADAPLEAGPAPSPFEQAIVAEPASNNANATPRFVARRPDAGVLSASEPQRA